LSVFTPGIATDATEGLLFLLGRNQALGVISDGDQIALPRGTADDGIYLGQLDGTPCFARFVGDDGLPSGSSVVPLRQLFGQISDEAFGIAGQALALTAWDRDHRFCGRCGAETVRSTRSGYAAARGARPARTRDYRRR
jgi:NAD+ diphosphatase